ncbi:D-alanyl-D-alanine carboxypeptidase [Planktothrix mougeotii]|uniref:D-alanyl-D-alanine carboxypeptidase n=1 Tax=Planktothrix mougeotii LEGE 06226 TaxID=1828728 RepID=A0ABR9UKB4_9CYAN|nr:D-alanyl-D-alanine carboxypeptidase [Planktothrix mougeotii]MBE9146900.1 D-alanyl-D-alanine carboxypeptidase [Planktothrix mougeotii LEGE 06226]
MIDIISSGLVSVWLEMAGVNQEGLNASVLEDLETELSQVVFPQQPDPVAEAVVQQYLNRLSSKGLSKDIQGVWVQSSWVPLAKNSGTTPLPAASLTKIATSLASLQVWNPEHRFETLIGVTGPIVGGVVQGDLVITGNGDPFFIWEEAIALGNTLNQMGIRGVTGNLIIAGNFYMNYEVDPVKAGQLFKQALNSASWNEEIIYQHSRMTPGTAKPQVVIAGNVVSQFGGTNSTLIIRHHSLALVEIIKQMNIYSNNLMAEILAANVGGAARVRQLASQAAGVPIDEIRLINGSGLEPENQISPRAVVGMFMALARYLQDTNLTVADLFPIAGIDTQGTLEDRKIPVSTPVKTGTLSDVSALAGVLPTRDRGLVWFAIINRGTDLDGLRADQDLLLQQLLSQWGSPNPLPELIQPHIDGRRPGIGDPNRNQILVQTP